MKKVFTFILAVLYLGVSSGMALQVHYCMDKVSELTILPVKSDKCSKCGMSGNECCRDEVKFLKLQDAHKQSVATFFVSQPVEHIFRDIPHFILPVFENVEEISPATNDPPASELRRIHIMVCRFNV